MAGVSASDVRSVLSLPTPSTAGPSQSKLKTSVAPERTKKPEGISRELYSLIGPSAPSLAAQFTKPRLKQKPNLGSGGTTRWEWRSFKNAARSDNLRLSHWTKASEDPEAEYAFAKYNVQPNVYVYTQDEYARFLEDPHWSKEETDYLFALVRDYDQRFYVVADRYDYPGGTPRTLEDIKDRYFSVCRKLVRHRPWAGDEASKNSLIASLTFDKDREIARKQYVAGLENRTQAQIAEETALFLQLKRLEQSERKFRKDRDELLRVIAGIESGLPDLPVEEENLANGGGLHIDTKKASKRRAGTDLETPTSATSAGPSNATIALGPLVPKKHQTQRSHANDALHCIHRTETPQGTSTKNTHTPVYLRSFKLPVPKSATAPKIAQVLGELGISHTRLVMPTRENCNRLESLIEAAAALVETKKLVDKVEQDIRISKIRLASSEGKDSESGGAGTPGAMEVDEDAEGVEEDGEGRAQSVVSTRSSKSIKGRKQSRRSMSISSVDTAGTGAVPKRRKR
ncbi:hypothetical protein K474DRAFT_531469 [Panus rudis PR-1116 ss-1]|nr:hypothetical protein K474DRAFT_531469 [Panus rudis PR-1116 ss-1]